ncbi:hypothetical protein M9H77_21396 [Catharanthus roseus]|uniref:Uncharacterized protein n=1 Tax=Catharanthus roseus TaxID=4058 RepID=A0ACC0AQ52_CATRO|nr:hypothetical protein M9H77_21396 [Catharanthus roseus]
MDEPLIFKKAAAAETSNRAPSPRYININPSRQQTNYVFVNGDTLTSPSKTPNSPLANLLADLNKNKKTRLTGRSHSAPSVLTDTKEEFCDSLEPRPAGKSVPSVVKQSLIGVAIYLIVGVAVYILEANHFKAKETWKPVDGLYFTVVTLCTIGYGDIVPDTILTKLYTCALILVGFGFIDTLLNGLVTYVLDRQEAVFLSAFDERRFNTVVSTYMMDTAKGRMRTRIKVVLSLAVVVGCLAIGTVMVHTLERLSWINSFYLSVTSVTTVGYGDYAFSTLGGRIFAIIWLLVSTLAVARAFLFLTELRIDRRNRKVAKWVLQRKMTPGDLVAADLDQNGSIR